MWNKVYYNKNWYNLDLTWDDPLNNLKNNVIYDYFMISDERMFLDHVEDNFSFETPEAADDTKSYYAVNKKYAEDLDSAKSILGSSIITAAKNNNTVLRLQCSTEDVYDELVDYLAGDELYSLLTSAKDSSNKNLVDTTFNYAMNDGQYTAIILIFYKNTSLSKYYSNTDILSKDTKKALKAYGIK